MDICNWNPHNLKVLPCKSNLLSFPLCYKAELEQCTFVRPALLRGTPDPKWDKCMDVEGQGTDLG